VKDFTIKWQCRSIYNRNIPDAKRKFLPWKALRNHLIKNSSP